MRSLMKVLKNIFGKNTKISADNIVMENNNKANNLTNMGLFAKVSLSTASFDIPASTYTKIPFNYSFKMDNGLELRSDGGIKINTNSKVAIVTARVRVETSCSCVLSIRKNSEDNSATNSMQPLSWGHITIQTIIKVEKGDIIYCELYSNNNNSVKGGGNPPIWVSMEVTLI